MSTVYSNYPYRANEVWVMGHPDESNKGWKFLFKAEIGELEYYGERAWNPTMHERAVKKKCREIRKQSGINYHFEFCDKWEMRRYIDNGRANFYSNFPMEDFEECAK